MIQRPLQFLDLPSLPIDTFGYLREILVVTVKASLRALRPQCQVIEAGVAEVNRAARQEA